MKNLLKTLPLLLTFCLIGCDDDPAPQPQPNPINTEVKFNHVKTIMVGGETAAEISAYDATTQKLFVVNAESNEIAVYNIKDINNPVQLTAIPLANGAPNSVAAYDGKVAVAIEDNIKQNAGKIALYNAENGSLINSYTVGALPDMVTFSKDGKLLISANEGEPDDTYTNDPEGSVSIIEVESGIVTTLNFDAFNADEASLKSNGFRVFGPNANLAKDVEPEYVTVSDDSKIAWVSLQENNGIAKVNLVSKTIEAIYPLGFKNYNEAGNEIDASNKDDVKELKNWPVYGMYQPDGITYVNINGNGYIISANEGDARDYDSFSEEGRIKDITLDETTFPISEDYQNEANLGRLLITNTLGDEGNDGDFEKLYSYGARSFSIWSENGTLIYDSGNSIAQELLARTPDRFNDDDSRSDDKGAEPESVEVLNMSNERYILFVGLERTDQVLVYDITNPTSPVFLDILSHEGDEAPEGLLVIPSSESPSGKDLVIVSNEDSGTVSIYENQ
ncbi:choice-of-anchor I family protein [Tenacibaculum sp. IB213877]|uniref:choice-of-anchor I family protein n=1 Tax=Tenacibaculum sp. IB213877 TaxID=3097351 RepID=UPI002A5AE6C0|nr:choice-of-anchor I family protein [Tenacibaculum sp. IB213877]MDY0780894.1 choice-of-anchor I family protein [Tenacibaculum sp. IB213877]